MAFETTYAALHARVTAQLGQAEADRICPGYARHFVAACREEAATATPDDAAVLLRLANEMNPDAEGVPDAAAHQ